MIKHLEPGWIYLGRKWKDFKHLEPGWIYLARKWKDFKKRLGGLMRAYTTWQVFLRHPLAFVWALLRRGETKTLHDYLASVAYRYRKMFSPLPTPFMTRARREQDKLKHKAMFGPWRGGVRKKGRYTWDNDEDCTWSPPPGSRDQAYAKFWRDFDEQQQTDGWDKWFQKDDSSDS